MPPVPLSRHPTRPPRERGNAGVAVEYNLLVNAIRPETRVRELRREQTPTERVLWERLRDRRVLGLKFRRQCPINRYIADFCCKDPRLVVELDGEIHEVQAQMDHDRNRDAYIRSLGYEILRFPNHRILAAPAEVITEISRAALRLRPSLIHTPAWQDR
jgi:very-short-patch-repair endonuclease